MKRTCALATFLALAAGAAPAAQEGPWPAPVEGWAPPRPGEHPRLFFRKSDLPALKERARTPEGQAILKRLRFLLNGGDGETMPKARRPVDAAFGDKSQEIPLPEGAYSIGHASGYGLLYQLTSEKKYADLGRQCFEWAFEGVRDRDGKGRYSWKQPTGALRCGPSIGAYAIGYDLCYDGWDPDFRRKVTEAFMNYDEGPHCSLEECALGKRQHPGSNHWGAEIGGPAMVLLAIKGDPGADDAKVDKLLEGNARCVLRQLNEGWGDHGWFAEGDGCGAISSDTSFVPGLQAWRAAGGKDFITPRPNAPWMTLKWAMQTVGPPGKPSFPHRGVYDHNVWARTGLSGSGTFAQGFGAIAGEHRPALLWLYNRIFRDADEKEGKPCDTVSPYPHRAVLSFINWPIGEKEKDPAEVLPRAVEDRKHAYYMFRNRWKDENDIVITALLKNTRGNYSVKGGDVIVWGLGQKTSFPAKLAGNPGPFRAWDQGGVVTAGNVSFGVDFSGASGADALIIMSGASGGGSGKGDTIKVQSASAGGTSFLVMTLSASGRHPEAKAERDRLVVGGQAVSAKDGGLVFEKAGG